MKTIKPPAKDILITAVLAVLAIGTSIAAGWIVLAPELPKEKTGLTGSEEIRLVRGKEIIDHIVVEEKGIARVNFAYVGDLLPPRLAENEVSGARTASSFTKDLGVMPGGTEKKLETIVFPQPQFIEREDGWHAIEYASVRKENFDAGQTISQAVSVFLPTAHAETISVFGGAGDGYITCQYQTDGFGTCGGFGFAAVQAAATGDSANPTLTGMLIDAESFAYGAKPPNDRFAVYRVFIPFNTSSIPANAQILSATLGVYAYDIAAATGYATVVQTSQADSTTLANADYDAVGSTEGIDSGERKETSTMSTSAYTTFALNSTGRSWIKKSGQTSNCGATAGYTCLGLRYEWDITNTEPSLAYYYTGFRTSEQTGTSQDPYLSVTYALPFAFWQFQDF